MNYIYSTVGTGVLDCPLLKNSFKHNGYNQ